MVSSRQGRSGRPAVSFSAARPLKRTPPPVTGWPLLPSASGACETPWWRNANPGARKAHLLGRPIGDGAGALLAFAAVELVIAHAEVADSQFEQGTQPVFGILLRGRPVAVGYDAGLQTRVAHHAQSFEQDRVEQERLATLEVNRVDGPDLLDLAQQFAKLAQGEGALESRSSVQKTMITLAGSLVGEQDLDSGKHEGRPFRSG